MEVGAAARATTTTKTNATKRPLLMMMMIAGEAGRTRCRAANVAGRASVGMIGNVVVVVGG